MGSILLQAFLRDGLLKASENLGDRGPPGTRGIAQEQAQSARRNRQCGSGAQRRIVFLCVKPQVVADVVREIRPVVRRDHLLVSVAASVPTDMIERGLEKDVPVVRAMPNTPCALGVGMTGLCKGQFAQKQHLDQATTFFSAVGRTVIVDEKHMDAVTGLSASGPAYIYIILESLAEAGVKVGLPRDIATLLAAQTTMGAARDSARNRRPSSSAQGRRHHPGWMHHRRHSGTRRRQTARNAD